MLRELGPAKLHRRPERAVRQWSEAAHSVRPFDRTIPWQVYSRSRKPSADGHLWGRAVIVDAQEFPTAPFLVARSLQCSDLGAFVVGIAASWRVNRLRVPAVVIAHHLYPNVLIRIRARCCGCRCARYCFGI